MTENLFTENLAIYEIKCKNMVDPDRSQVTIWCKRIAYWVTKATDTHSEYVILIAFPLQQWFHEPATILRYTYTACPDILSPRLSSHTFTLGNTSFSHSFCIFFPFHYFFYSFSYEFPSSFSTYVLHNHMRGQKRAFI
jgi:hypothetical protein